MEDELIKEYETIWAKYKTAPFNQSTISSKTPLLSRDFVFQFDAGLQRPDILYMGINPSYKHGQKKEKRTYLKSEVSELSYFKPFKNIEEELKSNRYKLDLTWTHIDALVFKETQQSFVRKTLFQSPEGLNFIMDQLNVSRKILEYFNPSILVVSNTMARELLGKNRGRKGDKEYGVWMGLKFTFDDKLGTYVIVDSGVLNGTVVFFLSMLSGQRALDLGSRERLIWQIARVKNKSS